MTLLQLDNWITILNILTQLKEINEWWYKLKYDIRIWVPQFDYFQTKNTVNPNNPLDWIVTSSNPEPKKISYNFFIYELIELKLQRQTDVCSSVKFLDLQSQMYDRRLGSHQVQILPHLRIIPTNFFIY